MNRLALLIAAFWALCQPAFASGMQTPIMISSPATAPSASANRFLSLASGNGEGSWYTTEAPAETPMPTGGTISDLQVKMNVAPGSGSQAFTITLDKGGSAQTLTCQVLGAATSCSDHVGGDAFTVSAGDLVDVKVAPSGTPSISPIPAFQISFLLTTTDDTSAIFSDAASTTTGTLFYALGSENGGNSDRTIAGSVIPAAGNITDIYLALSTPPGGITTRTYTLEVNGVPSLLTCTILSAGTGRNCSSSIAVSAGDVLDLAETQSGTPAAAAVQVGLKWVPTTSGQSVAFGTFFTSLSSSATRYGNLNGRVGNSFATAQTDEVTLAVVAPVAFTMKTIWGSTSVAFGSGATRDFTIRQSPSGTFSDTALTVNFGGTSTLKSSTSTDVSVAQGDLLDISTTPHSSPAASNNRVGAVVYIAPAPPVGGNHNGLLLVGVGQ